MEGVAAQGGHAHERSRPSLGPRTTSRSSTSSTFQASSASVSHDTPRSQQPMSPQSHPAHRFHHRTCSQSPTGGSRSRRSREPAEDSTSSKHNPPPVSNLLQERLQRGRKVEITRSSSNISGGSEKMSNSDHLPTSPVRRRGTSTDSRRPSSSGGEAIRKKGLGLKEIEQVGFPSVTYYNRRLLIISWLLRPCQHYTSRTLTSNSSYFIDGSVKQYWRSAWTSWNLRRQTSKA
jgi:hypothetical protein